MSFPKFECGECGQTKPPTDDKPKANADCAMTLKGGTCNGSEPSGGSIVSKIKELFGIRKDPRLVDLCAHLQVPDEQIRHHRDVFNPQLFVRKDGYMTPFKVECQEACESIQEDNVDEEDCEDEDFDECECDDQDLEDECVEDAEGECILEDSAECMDEECKLFFEKEGEGDEESTACQAMTNFLIRVQAPYSETSSTNQTCEQIISRLTNNFKYPEPGPKPEKKGKDDDCGEVELVVKQISVEDPSCECPPAKKKCKTKGGKGKAKAPPSSGPGGVPCPCQGAQFGNKGGAPPRLCGPCQPSGAGAGPKAPPPTASDQGGVAPPAEEPCDPPPKESGSGSGKEGSASGDSGKPKSFEEAEPCPPLPPEQNDCEVLNQAELLEKKLRDIRCGCPSACTPPCGPCPGLMCYGNDGSSVWTPPPPTPCPRCGAATRGLTDDCYLCNITRKMRSGIPEINTGLTPEFKQAMEMIEDKSDSCTPEYLEDGSIKYKGGACMTWAKQFLWFVEKRNPPGYFDQFANKCGQEDPPPIEIDLCDEVAKKPNFNGGMTIEECKYFLWGKTPPEKEPPPKRVCKPKEKEGEKCPCPKRPK